MWKQNECERKRKMQNFLKYVKTKCENQIWKYVKYTKNAK